MTQARTQPSLDYGYSRGLAPWCLDRPTNGSTSNPNYWSCGLVTFNLSGPAISPLNVTELDALSLGISNIDTTLDYIDTNGTFTTILAPKDVPAGFDYYASSFGVSIQCQPVRNNSCTIDTIVGNVEQLASFNCSDAGLGLRLSGTLYAVEDQLYEMDLHSLLHGPPPFEAIDHTFRPTQDMLDAAANLSDDDASTIFGNPWRLLSMLNLKNDQTVIDDSDNRILIFGGLTYFSMIACNVTGMYLILEGHCRLVMLTLSSMERQLHLRRFKSHYYKPRIE
jgi:hypothetical protein